MNLEEDLNLHLQVGESTGTIIHHLFMKPTCLCEHYSTCDEPVDSFVQLREIHETRSGGLLKCKQHKLYKPPTDVSFERSD